MARVGLSSNRKFLRLTRAVGNKALARGVLEILWEPCFESGDPYVGTSDDIEAVCDWRGERGVLTTALLDAGAPKGAGFIEPYEGSVRDATEPHYQIHDFFHHCPEYARTRLQREREHTTPKICAICGGDYYSRNPSRYCGPRCRKEASRRGLSQDVTERPCDVTAGHSDVSRSHGPPTPTPVRTDLSSTDVRTTSKGVRTNSSAPKNGAEPVATHDAVNGFEESEEARPHHVPQDATAGAGSPDASPVVLTFPVVGPDGPSWPLREARIAHWSALYPNVDVLGEARQALAWVEADGTRRKTARGMAKFLVGWLNRSVDAPRTRGPTVTGSLKTAGNRAAITEFLRGRGHVMD